MFLLNINFLKNHWIYHPHHAMVLPLSIMLGKVPFHCPPWFSCPFLAPLPRHNGQAFLGLPDLTILQNCTSPLHKSWESLCDAMWCVQAILPNKNSSYCSTRARFKNSKILPTVVPWELFAQNYIIYRNPKTFKVYFSQSKSKKKGKKIQNLFL
jgi:hypothetical protein